MRHHPRSAPLTARLLGLAQHAYRPDQLQVGSAMLGLLERASSDPSLLPPGHHGLHPEHLLPGLPGDGDIRLIHNPDLPPDLCLLIAGDGTIRRAWRIASDAVLDTAADAARADTAWLREPAPAELVHAIGPYDPASDPGWSDR